MKNISMFQRINFEAINLLQGTNVKQKFKTIYKNG